MKKVIYTFLLFCIFTNTNANNKETFNQSGNKDNTVTLEQIGQGKTKDEAKYNALRNAIEIAFGTFISSNTKILNDELIKDEIVSVSSGNIQKFEILSETKMPDGSYTSVVKATVSIGKLITFCESKGISVEFKGGAFAANIKLEEMNKKNETAVMRNLSHIANNIIKKGLYDFSIKADEPKKVLGGEDNGKWQIELNITSKGNKNLTSIIEIFTTTLRSISLSNDEVKNYNSKNLSVYFMKWDNEIFYFRSMVPVYTVMKTIGIQIPRAACMFKIENGITSYEFPYNELSSDTRRFDLGHSVFKIQNLAPLFSTLEGNARTEDIKYFIKYGEVYNTSYYTYREGTRNGSVIVNTNLLFESNNRYLKNGFKVYNIMSISELEKINEFKVQPIMK